MIEFKNISKVFSEKKKQTSALNNISLFIPRGKIYGIIGASGAGKSTLLRCANLLERPSSGKVLIDGKDLTALPRKELANIRRHIGMIFQHFNLLSSRTVFENVALPLEFSHIPEEKRRQVVEDLLQTVGLEDKAGAYPSQLSGGQKQRVAIARALADNPKVLLCDEATSALDPESTRGILDLLKRLNTNLGITILLITHEMEVIKTICDEVAVMSKGSVIESGTVADLFSDPKTDLTRNFVASSYNARLPQSYQKSLKNNNASGDLRPVFQLEFAGKTSDETNFSDVITLFRINLKIISARLEYIGSRGFGFLLVELSGDPGQFEKAINYLIKKQIKVVKLGYV